MNTNELRAYIGRAKELESAVFTQKKLMDDHKAFIDAHYPSLPTQKHFNQPQRPTHPPIDKGGPVFAISTLVLGVLFLAVPVLVSFINPREFTESLSFLVLGAALLFLAKVGFRSHAEEKKLQDDALSKYQRAVEQYKQDLEVYNQKTSEAEAVYQQELTQYNMQYNEYVVASTETMTRHSQALTLLVDALDQHYSQNIVFGKYRNLVAISAIDEYLASGRCTQLEGADGAYNLYELELRQNIIVGQLSAVIDNLENIQQNQYSLYQEISKANQTVDRILQEIINMEADTALTAYFSQVTALAATAPRVGYAITL